MTLGAPKRGLTPKIVLFESLGRAPSHNSNGGPHFRPLSVHAQVGRSLAYVLLLWGQRCFTRTQSFACVALWRQGCLRHARIVLKDNVNCENFVRSAIDSGKLLPQKFHSVRKTQNVIYQTECHFLNAFRKMLGVCSMQYSLDKNLPSIMWVNCLRAAKIILARLESHITHPVQLQGCTYATC